MRLSRFIARWPRHFRFVVCVVALGIVLRCCVADFGRVAGGSMKPTLRDGDYIVTNKLAYGLRLPFTSFWPLRWSQPKPGDIVVLCSPVDGRRLVKRIIASSGDALGRDLPSASDLPPGHYFVRGDDTDSIDSRTFGWVPCDQILGQVVGIIRIHDLMPVPCAAAARGVTARAALPRPSESSIGCPENGKSVRRVPIAAQGVITCSTAPSANASADIRALARRASEAEFTEITLERR